MLRNIPSSGHDSFLKLRVPSAKTCGSKTFATGRLQKSFIVSANFGFFRAEAIPEYRETRDNPWNSYQEGEKH